VAGWTGSGVGITFSRVNTAVRSLWLCLAAGWAMGVMAFQPPSRVERMKAIGPLDGLPRTARLLLEAQEDFSPLPVPRPGDWLAVHREEGQTWEEFRRGGWPRPDGVQRVIYLQPLGDFAAAPVSLEELKEFAGAFFQMPVRVAAPLQQEQMRLTSRINPYTGRRQLLTRDILEYLAEHRPVDAFCVLAVTFEDLYPAPSWNFVFGEASVRDRVAVYSFARYDPSFYGERRSSDCHRLVLRRSCKVLAHEICHLFGMSHCIYFHCLMNGSNHLQESDARPLHLCPVCLRKLWTAVGFDLVERYRALEAFFSSVGLTEEAAWMRRRLDRASGAR